MSFAYPLWLIAGLVICCLMLLQYRLAARKRQTALQSFVAPQLMARLTASISHPKRLTKQVLVVAAVMLLFTALARPQFGYQWVDVKRKGIDLLFALDTSKSMLAEDIRPNRLKRASLAILDFVNQLDGDRVGLMPFAGSAYLMCPLTTDYDAFAQSLQAVDTNIIPKGGTNLGEVISSADQILSTSANHKILIILTDGENLQGDVLATAAKAAQNGLTIYTVGVGTAAGELIPITENGRQGFVKDDSGNFVTSKLDASTLTSVAEKTGGLYVPLGTSGQGLETVYQSKLSLIPKETLAERRHKVPVDRFEWPLAVAILLLVIETLTGERKNGRVENGAVKKFWRLPGRTLGIFCMLSALSVSLLTQTSYASPGEDAFRAEKYLEASEYYSNQLKKKPDDPVLNYNYGTAAYRNNLNDEAAEAFHKALKSDDPHLQQKAYFNLGNSLYKKGAESLQAKPEETLKKWQEAVDAYAASAKLAPNDKIPVNNKDLVEKQIEELKKRLPPPQKQQKNQNQNQNQEGKKQDGSNSQNSQQDNGQGKQHSQDGNTNDNPGQEGQKNDQNSQNHDSSAAGAKNAGQPPQTDDASPADTGHDDIKAGNGSEPAPASDKQGQQVAKEGQPGQMSKDEAEQLLRAILSEEGKLNFVPNKNDADRVDKDW